MEDNEELHTRGLFIYRRRMGYTQTEVAKKLGLKDNTLISRWERGIAVPTLENAISLSRLYKTLVEELFYELSQNCQKQLQRNERKKRKTSGRDP